MTKQEKIQEAYGEWFKECSPDENGLSIINESYYPNIEWMNKGFGYNKPKSLQGIENNNGWIKIETEDDLPMQDCDVFAIINGVIKQRRFQLDISHLWINQTITHYQPITKPQPPIY